MPTYRNDTESRITDADRNYMEWPPGVTRALPYHVPHEALGLTKVSDEPAVGGETSVFGDWEVELTAGEPIVLDLPYFEAFELSIYARDGTATARVGDGGMTFVVRPDESHFGLYAWSRCPYVSFSSEEGATLRVKQEERNTKNTLRRGTK